MEAAALCSPWQLFTSTAVGGVAFFILGTVGNLRRAPLPLLLNVLLNLNQKLNNPSTGLTARQIYQLPIVTGAVGMLLGGYVGYRECQMERAFKEKWAKTKRSPSLEVREGSL